MKTLRGALCVVALVVLSAGAVMAQEKPTEVQQRLIAQYLAKKGYDYYRAQSTRMRTKSGDVYTWAPVHVARESGSGMATGRRMHKPFVVLKEIDASSPKLAAIAASHEPIPELTMVLEGESVDAASRDTTSRDAAKPVVSGAGTGKVVFQDLSIVSIEKVSATMEEVTLSYDKIAWTWTKGGVVSHDDWSPR